MFFDMQSELTMDQLESLMSGEFPEGVVGSDIEFFWKLYVEIPNR